MSKNTANIEKEALLEVRRLLLERADKQKELEAIDRAIEEAAGVESNSRPKRTPIKSKNLRQLCGLL